MLDIKFIREHQNELKEAIKNKNIDLDLEKLLEADKKRIQLSQEIEKLKSLKNDLNDLMKNSKALSNQMQFLLLQKQGLLHL